MKITMFVAGTALLFSLAAPFSTLTFGGMSCCSEPQAAASTQTSEATPKLALEGAAKPVFESYLAIHAALAGDSLEKIPASAAKLAQAVRADKGHTFPPAVASQADALAEGKDLAADRKAFKLLSEALIPQVKAGIIPAGTLYEVYCPMAKASWLQANKTVRNPYFGRSMLSCGQVKE